MEILILVVLFILMGMVSYIAYRMFLKQNFTYHEIIPGEIYVHSEKGLRVLVIQVITGRNRVIYKYVDSNDDRGCASSLENFYLTFTHETK